MLRLLKCRTNKKLFKLNYFRNVKKWSSTSSSTNLKSDPLWKSAQKMYLEPMKRGTDRISLNIEINDVIHGFRCISITPCPELNVTQVSMFHLFVFIRFYRFL